MRASEVCKLNWLPFPKISKKLLGYVSLSYIFLVAQNTFSNTNNQPIYPVTNPFNENQIAYFRQLPARDQILIVGEGYNIDILNITEVVIEEGTISFLYQNQQFNVQIIHNHQVPFHIMGMNQTQQYLQPLVVDKYMGISTYSQ